MICNNHETILVVGGNTPIGVSTIRILKSSGYNVISVNLHDGYGEHINDTAVTSYSVDLLNVEELESNFAEIVKKHQPFSGFVYLYGKGGVRPLSMTKPAFMRELINSNLICFVELVRILTKKKRFMNGGSIVALSSVSSIKGLKSKLAYCSSKAALDAAIRVLAAELANKKIRVNSIRKGWVASDMNLAFVQDNMSLSNNSDYNKQLLGEISADEVAYSIKFLLSEESKKITGTSLLLDGGYML